MTRATVLENGVVPTLILLALILVFYGVMKRRFGLTREEGVQVVFVFIAVSFCILTITCIWFRGQGMELLWPWQI